MLTITTPGTLVPTATLVIHDFDQWSNPRDSHLPGTTCFSWLAPDLEYAQ
jgi:hypothetical protein